MTDRPEPSEEEMAERLWSDDDSHELEGLREIQAQLDRDGAAARDAFSRRTVAAGPAKFEDDAIDALTKAMAATSTPTPSTPTQEREASSGAPGGPWLSWRWIGAAAAAILLVVFAPALFETENPAGGNGADPTDILLNPTDSSFLTVPVGKVESLTEFSWQRGPVDGAMHRVRIWYGREREGAHDQEFLAFNAPRWTPDPTVRMDLKALEDGFHWAVVEVEPTNGDETELGTAYALIAP